MSLTPNSKYYYVLGFILILSIIATGSYSLYLYQQLNKTRESLAETTAQFEESKRQLEFSLSELQKQNDQINNVLTDEQKRNLELERLREENEEQIDELEKLTRLDPELLKKYSKVFFLSENYAPPKLRTLNSQYVLNPNKELQVLREVRPFLEDLLKDAANDGLSLKVLSAYRSFEEQTQIKSSYSTIYGTGANQFSADQGYSEHQLGTTVDFTTPTIVGAYTSFENTAEFKWLQENAYKYGFILSYPKGNKYYTYEPWHWRFVGTDLARDLNKDEKTFYDLDQREIDEYLIKIFD